MTAAEFERLGVYDPRAPDAAQRLELLQFLVGVGATADDLVAYRDALPALGSVAPLRGGAALTLAEVVERSGMSEAKLRALNRAAGFPDPGPGDRMFSERFVDVAGILAGAEAVFGEPAVLQLVRVMGSAMARVADAIVSAFLVSVEPVVRGGQDAALPIARANSEAAALLPGVNALLDMLLRQHLIAARRSASDEAADSGYETRPLCVGFVDLVGSTALVQQLSTGELGGVLVEFENVASDLVTAGGGRVVKLIGDEILYSAPDERLGCAIAGELVAVFAEHPHIPAVRAGVAAGAVMLRDGDVFGPTVNLAARAVTVAGPGEIVAPPAVAAAAGLAAEPIGAHELHGFDEPVDLSRIGGRVGA